jgi:penicillin-binding protein 1A
MRSLTPSDIVRRRRERARQAHGRALRLARALAVAALLLALAAVFAPAAALAGGAAGLLAFVRDLPDVEALRDLPTTYAPSPATTRLYAYDAPDADGLRQPVLLDEIVDPRAGGAGWRSLVDTPPVVISATLAAVDPLYFDRPPLDLPAAATEWARAGVVTQAPSPLLAELVATHLRAEDPPLTPPEGRKTDASPPLTPPTSRGIGLPLPVGEGRGEGSAATRRDLQDWFLGWQIERRFGREQALEWTLNTAYYGHLAYGIDAAARVYFGVGAAELTAAQAALLAATARDPAANPFDAPDAARAGQAVVLAAMVQQGFLSPGAAADALAAPLALAPPPGSGSSAPAFARLARAELERVLGPARLARGGYTVETTLDLTRQAAAKCAVAAISQESAVGGGPACPVLDLPDEGGAEGAAIVALDAANGAILALAADALPARPTGTLVRPFIYLTALSQGYTAASLTTDVERIYLEEGRPVVPGDADGQYRGPLRLREALVSGRAAPAAQVLGWVGATQVLDNARALGVAVGQASGGLAFAEEGFSADLLSLSHAFAAVINGGVLAGAPGDAPRPATIVRVQAAGGAEVYAFAMQTRDALDPALAWLLSDMLAGGEPVAVAAGVSAAAGDAWAIAAAPGQVVGVWASGAADAANPTAAARALLAAAPGEPAAWPPPPGLTAVDVCALTGLLPRRDGPVCPTVREWFAAGTAPATTDTMTREVAINRETGRLATILTPAHLIERRVYTIYPPEAAQWAAEQGIATPPTEYDTIRRLPARVGGAAVVSPEAWTVVSGQWPVVGSAAGEGFAYYRLAYFPGLLPEEMVVLVERDETAVTNSELGVWDTTLVDDGLYTLLLTVARADGTFDEVAIPVTVANTPAE